MFVLCFRHASKKLPNKPMCHHIGTHSFECSKLNNQDVRKFHDKFYELVKTEENIKVEQDRYILRYIQFKTPKRSRPRTEHGARKQVTAKYFVPRFRQTSGTGLVQVCQKTFLSILNISKSRVQRLLQNQMKDIGSSPRENRGGDRKTALFVDKKRNVKNFLEQLIAVESHYTREKSKRQYLQSDCTVRKLWRSYNNQDGLEENLKVKYSYFRNIFVTDYNVSCCTPATDKCSRCIQLQEMIKMAKSPNEKKSFMIPLRVHKLRAKAFFNALKEDLDTQVSYSFDCQKNLVLPKIPDQLCYFSRQFYVYNFTICEGSSRSKQTKENTFIYTWTELQSKKGSNEIVSCVHDRLLNTNFTNNHNRIRLFADGCGGQNKNSTLMGMLSKWLLVEAPRHIKSVTVYFPTPGHSYMPPDRVFGRIEKTIKRKETIIQPEEYHKIFSEYGTITKPENGLRFFDWKSEVEKVFKKPGDWHFQFAPTKRFIITRSKKNNILIRGETSYNSDCGKPKCVAKKGKLPSAIFPTEIHIGIPPKPLKLKDVNKLLEKHFGPDWKNREDLDFYKHAIDDDVPEANEEDDEPMDDMETFV